MKIKTRKIQVIEISRHGARLTEEDEAYLEESLRVRIWNLLKNHWLFFFYVADYTLCCIFIPDGITWHMHFVWGFIISWVGRKFMFELIAELVK